MDAEQSKSNLGQRDPFVEETDPDAREPGKDVKQMDPDALTLLPGFCKEICANGFGFVGVVSRSASRVDGAGGERRAPARAPCV